MTDRENLEIRAKELDVSFAPNIGDVKLQAKVAAAEKKAGIPGAGPVLIVGPRKGRWRAGRHFNHAPTRLEEGDLTEDEMQMILDDPLLTIGPAPGDTD